MPSRDNWTETTLGDVAEASWGNTAVTKKQYTECGFTAFSASGPDGYVDWFEHDEKGVVLSAIGALCGKTWLADGKWTPIKNTIWIKSRSKNCLTDYLFLVSKMPGLWPIRGQAQPFISLGDVRLVDISLPPLDDQKRIVDLVSSVDTYIDSLQQQVDSARLARNAVLHELLSAGGDDWTETTLGEIGVSGFFSDGDWVESKDQDPEGDFRLLQLADIGDGVFLDKSSRWLNEEQFQRLRCTALVPGDILIARMPDPIARACLFPDGLPVSATVVDVAILRCGPSHFSEFLVMLINDVSFRAAADSLITGTTRQRISRSNLSTLYFSLPPLDEQKRIVEIVSSMDDVIRASEQTVVEAKNLRSGLLSDLLSGEHEIPKSYDKLLGDK